MNDRSDDTKVAMAPTRTQHLAASRRFPAPAKASKAGNAEPDDAVCSAACDVDVIDHAKVARARSALPAPATIGLLAETFKALGDATRLRIVSALAQAELCVCDLASLVGVSQSAVSHSLRVLRDLRLVRYRKVGKIAYYTLDDAHIVTLLGEGRRHVEEQAAERATA
jgi:ArsR family transcriptional regulator, lead/cadmium/zinc/bismuth-responsive transcriptional repressor